MKAAFYGYPLLLLLIEILHPLVFLNLASAQVIADFNIPDTICPEELVQITNLTTGGSNYYWNFCSGNSGSDPEGQNIGNPGYHLIIPTYSTLVKDGNNCFEFITDQGTQSVIRYFHGSSFQNLPSQTDNLGNFGSLSDSVEGIQVINDNGTWIGIVCNNNRLIRLNFGNSLLNNPSAAVIGPMPILNMAHGLIITRENGVWIGFISCTIGNKLIRINFGNSLINTPAFTNLGIPGNLSSPGQMSFIRENGNNYLFIMNLGSSTLSRLDFGTSLLNSPSGTNLGNICGTDALGITLIRDCGSIHGLASRYLPTGSSPDLLWEISFPDGITGPIITQSLGNIGELNRPSLFSELYRQNDTLFVYLSNRGNGTRTRLSFASCTNSSIPSSTAFNPPGYFYDQPGTYNIRLLVNEGQPDQASICKNIVVIPCPDSLVVDFEVQDTVCVGTSVSIHNNSSGGLTYYWNFCSGNPISDPIGTNIGNPGSLLYIPGYITLVQDGGICYSFITNHNGGTIVRYNHGNSFSNDPVTWTNLGNFGIISDTVQGIKICKDNGQWIGLVNDNNKIVRLNFGVSLANTPSVSVLGPFSMFFSLHGLQVYNEKGTWIAYVSCTWGNKLIRLNFGNSLLNVPLLTDLGTPGSMNMPSTFCIIKENEIWYALVVNYGDNTLTRLTFGSSLLNNPSGTNLGVACPSIIPGGIAIIRDCESTVGFQLNSSVSSPDLTWRLNFSSGMTGQVRGVSLGNIGEMSQPLRFSELVRVKDTLFLFATNHQDFSLSRLRFLPCNNSSIPSSSLYNPPIYTYNQTGTYNINLVVNEGLPDQVNLCKKIVVIDRPSERLIDTTLCYGDSCYSGGKWHSASGVYYDTIPLSSGCDSIVITTLDFKPEIPVDLGPDTTLCGGNTILLRTGVTDAAYLWQDGSDDSVFLVVSAGHYRVIVTKNNCNARDSVVVSACDSQLWFPNVFTPNADGLNDIFHAVGQGVSIFSMLIFNRWGEQVFETDNFDHGWDGRFREAYCPDGVYFYIATYEMADKPGDTHHAHGSVTLLR